MDAPTLHPASVKNCSIGDIFQKQPKVLILGDSHAMAFAGMLNVILRDTHLKGYLVTQSGTPFILGNISDWRENMPMKRNKLALKMIQKNHYDYVILGGYWNYYSDATLKKNIKLSYDRYQEFRYGLDHAIVAIISANSVPVIMLDVPPLLNIPMQCGYMRIGLNNCLNSIEKVEKV